MFHLEDKFQMKDKEEIEPILFIFLIQSPVFNLKD